MIDGEDQRTENGDGAGNPAGGTDAVRGLWYRIARGVFGFLVDRQAFCTQTCPLNTPQHPLRYSAAPHGCGLAKSRWDRASQGLALVIGSASTCGYTIQRPHAEKEDFLRDSTYLDASQELAKIPETQHERDLIALVLLQAVEESFRHDGEKARQWLRGSFAGTLLVLLDISPRAALERLEKKWARIDLEAVFQIRQVVH